MRPSDPRIQQPVGAFLLPLVIVASIIFTHATVLAGGGNLVENARFEAGEEHWEGFGAGFTIDDAVKHTGDASARCEIKEAGTVTGAMQTIVLNQDRAVPIAVGAWSRAVGVSVASSPHYSVWCDIEYTTDTRPGRVDLPGQSVAFSTGTHDWEQQELIISPEWPIASLNLYVLFRHRYTGTVWFDDVFVASLSDAPLQGTVGDFPELSVTNLPAEVPELFRAVPENEGSVLITTSQTRAAPSMPSLSAWINGKSMVLGNQENPGLHVRLPFTPMRSRSTAPEESATLALDVRQMSGEFIVTAVSRPNPGETVGLSLIFPMGMRLKNTQLHDWESENDSISVAEFAGRILVQTIMTGDADEDRLVLRLIRETTPGTATKNALPSAIVKVDRVGSIKGLELSLNSTGMARGVRLSDREISPVWKTSGDIDTRALGTGFQVEDIYTGTTAALVGETQVDGTAGPLHHTVSLPSMGLDFRAVYRTIDKGIDIQATLLNTLGGDRAVRLSFGLPIDLSGWIAWEDINTSQEIAPESPFSTRIYPWTCFTPASGSGPGLGMALAPDVPHTFSFQGSTSGGPRLSFDLGLSEAAATPGTVSVHFVLFPCDGKWAFRDASQRYYDLFPNAFRVISNKPGGWLFAFQAKDLANPEDYAYREGGPAGWQLDEKLGLLTCPYRIPTQRQIIFPELPTSDREAAEKIRQLAQTPLPFGWKTQGGTTLSTEHAREGSCSLLLKRSEGQGMVASSQDVRLAQKVAKPVTLSAQYRTENLSGEQDNAFGIYADLWLTNGERLFSQCAPFHTDSTDWKTGSVTLSPETPIETIRLYVLMRGSHYGSAWVDSVTVLEEGANHNKVANPGFEEHHPHSYASMMLNCSSHDAQGMPYTVRRDNVGADVRPKNPIYNVVYSVNCDPDLYNDRDDALTVGQFELEHISEMLDRNPALDGVYLDSISGWVTRYPNYRREHWQYATGSLTYDRETGDLYVPGMAHTYEFMQALQQRLQPKGKVVFPNLGRDRKQAFLYFVTDVIGLEGGIRKGDIAAKMSFYRTMSYHKPVLIMDYLEVLGHPTRHASREGFETYWKWCLTYGCYPSIGRSCAEAYEKFGDVYRRFREPLRMVTQAGWEPVTYATAAEGVLVERFGRCGSGDLCFVLYNPGKDDVADAKLRIDCASLGIPEDYAVTEVFSKCTLQGPAYQLPMPAETIALIALQKPAR